MSRITLKKPLVSVITICKNPGSVLRDTIQSVLNQSYHPLEYLIIDGASDQDTVDILKQYEDVVDLIISEADRGISHAFNKGIDKSKGAIIGLLNGGDTYSPDAIERAVSALQHSEADFCFGDCIFHETADYSFLMQGEADYLNRIHYRMPVFNHPTVFVKRSAYEECGLFDEKWKFCMDYELLRRLVHQGRKGQYIPETMAEMDRGGLSISNMVGSMREVRHISMKYGLGWHQAWYHYGLSLVRYWAGSFINRLFGKGLMKQYRKIFTKGYNTV